MHKTPNYFFNDKILARLLDKLTTPCYLYDLCLLDDTLKAVRLSSTKYSTHPVLIHFAVKANNHPRLLEFISKYQLGADCVSGGEINEALQNKFEAQHIVFAGVGKLDWEIELALNKGIYAFNVESIQEIEVINYLAGKLNKIAKIFIRINPDIDAKTHKHISTGMCSNKFGVNFIDLLNYLPHLAIHKNIKFIGLHYHVGSQITDFTVYRNLCLEINENYAVLANKGINLTDIDLGGGLGVDYVNPEGNPIANFDEYFTTIVQNLFIPKNVKLHFEFGRSIIAQSGLLLSNVIFTKTTGNTNFVIIDAGMNDLMRPALYNAKHKIIKINETNYHNKILYNIAGPICESTDIFASGVYLPRLHRGNTVAILSCGAYGRVLANTYNSRKMVSEYFIQDLT
ncbi:MAG: diaminopimelate decarboxylase [Burkholderiales bacterium]|nr:diaminopimelate decarboxylase [Burkholderiales bacterium]